MKSADMIEHIAEDIRIIEEKANRNGVADAKQKVSKKGWDMSTLEEDKQIIEEVLDELPIFYSDAESMGISALVRLRDELNYRIDELNWR